jgi:hypothetical protein
MSLQPKERVRVVRGYHVEVRALIGQEGVVLSVLEEVYLGVRLDICTVLIAGKSIDLWFDEVEKIPEASSVSNGPNLVS